jgi:hypothetical protein
MSINASVRQLLFKNVGICACLDDIVITLPAVVLVVLSANYKLQYYVYVSYTRPTAPAACRSCDSRGLGKHEFSSRLVFIQHMEYFKGYWYHVSYNYSRTPQ